MSHTIGFLTVDPKGRTTLPLEMREALGLTPQTQIRVDRADDGTIELVPTVSIPQDQLWYHSPEGRERLRRAEESFGEGRSTRTVGEVDTQRYLDSLKSPRAGKQEPSR
jgi:AbrB family looped-hinge helix DNA binding protein